MHVYKKNDGGEIYCFGENTNIEGYTYLGYDSSINSSNCNYVTGFSKGKAVFDTVRKQAIENELYNSDIQKQIDDLEYKCQRSIREYNSSSSTTEQKTTAKGFIDKYDSDIKTLRVKFK